MNPSREMLRVRLFCALLTIAVTACSEGTGPGTGPKPVLTGPWTSLSAGGYHTCGLTAGGAAFCWGWNSDGQLGDGRVSYTPGTSPVAVIGF